MGMDVYGLKPTSKRGEYFRSDFERWRPLATYVQEVAPEITKHCTSWQTNDGDGLGADDANELANRLLKELDSGRTLSYQRRVASRFDGMPEASCWRCDGIGQGGGLFANSETAGINAIYVKARASRDPCANAAALASGEYAAFNARGTKYCGQARLRPQRDICIITQSRHVGRTLFGGDV